MKITITSTAKKQFKSLPKAYQILVAQKIRQLGTRKEKQYEKLSGYNNHFRFRLGSYRIIFAKFSGQIKIILIGHRKDIYKKLNRLFK